MAVYTFHLPRHAVRGDARVLDRAVLVRDGFSWGALIFQVLWCLWNRLWLVAVGFVVVSAALSVGLTRAGVPEVAVGLAGLLLAILLGLEANDLRRRSLERRGLAVRGIVVAPDRLEAERRAFSIWLASADEDDAPGDDPFRAILTEAVPGGGYAASATRESSVIGLFPAAEEPR